jgi:hypothetical protein
VTEITKMSKNEPQRPLDERLAELFAHIGPEKEERERRREELLALLLGERLYDAYTAAERPEEAMKAVERFVKAMDAVFRTTKDGLEIASQTLVAGAAIKMRVMMDYGGRTDEARKLFENIRQDIQSFCASGEQSTG